MDERMRRQWAASEAISLGWGGVSLVSSATGLARNTIAVGLGELEHRRRHPHQAITRRIRGVGGGRKSMTQIDPGLLLALEALARPREAILNLPCAGPARAPPSWPKN